MTYLGKRLLRVACVLGILKQSAESLLYICSCPSVLEVTYKRSVILHVVVWVL